MSLPVQTLQCNSENTHAVLQYIPNDNSILFIYKDHIDKYNIENDSYTKFMDITFSKFRTRCTINQLQNIFVMSTSKFTCFIDLNTKSITKRIKYNTTNGINRNSPSMCHLIWIPKPINEIHSIDFIDRHAIRHRKFDNKQEKFINISSLKYTPDSTVNSLIVFIKSQNKLILFSIRTATFMHDCNIESNKQIDYKWNKMDIMRPMHSVDVLFNINKDWIQVLNVFDTIIILFDFENRKIFVLDLLNKNKKWISSDKTWPNQLDTNVSWIQFVKSDDNIHFVVEQNHYKISILDIIPHTMYKKYLQMYHDLVVGYCKQQFSLDGNSKYVINYPIVLIKLIVRYYLTT